MTVDELKAKVEQYREKLTASGTSRKMVTTSPTGPVGIGIIDVLVEALAAQDARIAALERDLHSRK